MTVSIRTYFILLLLVIMGITSTTLLAQETATNPENEQDPFEMLLEIGLPEGVTEERARELMTQVDQLKSDASDERWNEFMISLTEEEQSFVILYEFQPQQESVPEIPEAVSCFDHYTFGSVSAKPFSEISTAAPGIPLTFGLEITNENPYPVVNAQVHVRVFRVQEDRDERKDNADHIVDQFTAVDNLSLDAGERVRQNFTWDVPNYALSGDYRMVTFVTSSDRYNLNGLSFTDDITGNETAFSVDGQESGVYFDKNTVTVDGRDHAFASALPRVLPDEPVIVEAEVVNTTNQSQTVTVDWQAYWWDGLLEQNKVGENSTEVTIPANSRGTVSYTLTDTEYPVYLVIPRLTYEDTSSVLNVRFTRSEKNMPRINYPAVEDYPLKGDQENTFFVCLHNAGDGFFVDNVVYTAEFLDIQDNVFHTYTYEGPVTGAMMGLVDSFTLPSDHDYFSILSTLSFNGEVVDTDEVVYDCEELGSGTCSSDKSRNSLILWGSIAIIVLILIIGGIAIRRRATLSDSSSGKIN